jgi:ketosteroid isomerase-like protein
VSQSGNGAVIAPIYGLNWAALRDRERSLAAFARVIAPEFEMRLSPEIGSRWIRSTAELLEFAQAIEQDFEECVYEIEELLEAPGERVVVIGEIRARGRTSKLPLEGRFAHVWSLREGRGVLAQAFRDRSQALEAAGL